MELYHISPKQYSPGEKVSVAGFSGQTFYHKGLLQHHKVVDKFLSEGRPKGEPARDCCLYAFEKREYCVHFRKGDIQRGKEMHLYHCEMNSQVGHPMILVGMICSLEGNAKDALKSEYWHPTKKWNFMEYLASEMEILEEIDITNDLCFKSYCDGGLKYSADAQEAKRFMEYLKQNIIVHI